MYCLIFKKYKEKQNLKAFRTSNGKTKLPNHCYVTSST